MTNLRLLRHCACLSLPTIAVCALGIWFLVDKVPEIEKAERDRVSAIQSICNGEFPEIEREAVSAGWTPEDTTRKVLDAIRAARPAASEPGIQPVRPPPDA